METIVELVVLALLVVPVVLVVLVLPAVTLPIETIFLAAYTPMLSIRNHSIRNSGVYPRVS